MNLYDYQRAVLRVSFDLVPSEDDLAKLGDPARFRMYRHMVRSRLEDMAQIAFKRSRELVGEQAFSESFARFLAQGGPRSPIIREVTAAFGTFAQGDAELLAHADDFVVDVLRFEQCKWEIAYQPASYPVLGEKGVRELDFEGTPVLNPALQRLTLDRRALPFCDLDSAPLGERFTLLVYRPTHNEVRWWALSPFFAGLMVHFEQGDMSVADAVRAVAQEQERAVDEALLEELATDLTLAVQRDVVFGVRD